VWHDAGTMALYVDLGRTYTATRRADARIAARITAALGDTASVINIGAGTGSYEPPSTLMAIEPSQTMIRQRPPGAAAAVQAVAERLPMRDQCVDAALAVLRIHHWTDIVAGIAEMQRIARRRVVIPTCDSAKLDAEFWLLADYLPAARKADAEMAVPIERLMALLVEPVVTPVPVPHDCSDGFGAAYWRRPEAYLDPAVQAGISLLARADPASLARGLTRLAADVDSGRWHDGHADLLERDELDLGYCLITAETRPRKTRPAVSRQ
jgi:SAM-dependent methyltransferase